jgi:hypothetical protein
MILLVSVWVLQVRAVEIDRQTLLFLWIAYTIIMGLVCLVYCIVLSCFRIRTSIGSSAIIAEV